MTPFAIVFVAALVVLVVGKAALAVIALWRSW